MRLLIEVGYQKVLFGEGASVSELIHSLDGAAIVSETGGWNEPKRYVIDQQAVFNVSVISSDAVELPENDDGGEFDRFHKVASERDEARKELKELKAKLAEIEKATAA